MSAALNNCKKAPGEKYCSGGLVVSLGLAGNRLMACALTQRRNHGPYLENPGFRACHGVFRARRTVFLRHATCRPLDEQTADPGANTTLGRLLATLSVARAFRRARHHPGASKAPGRILGGNGAFFCGSDYVRHRRSVEAELRRAAVSTQSKKAF